MFKIKEHYHGTGYPKLQFIQLYNELKMDFGHFTSEAHKRRVDTLNEAKLLPKGKDLLTKEIYSERKSNPHDASKWSPKFSAYYEDKENDLVIGAFKPGKEAGSDYLMTDYSAKKNRVSNPHDMFPVVLHNNNNIIAKITLKKNGEVRYYTPFTLEHVSDIFDFIIARPNGGKILELLGALIVRMAFMLDHKEVSPGKWRLEFPIITMTYISQALPFVEFNQGDYHRKISIKAFLHWLDILAINEEIKVDGKGHKNLLERGKKLTDKGRTNTLLTYSYCIAAMLQRQSIGRFVFGYNRRSIYPLKHSEIFKSFPILDGKLMEYWHTASTSDLGWY